MRSIMLAIVVFMTAGKADAGLSYTGQERSVSASVSSFPSNAATDYGKFDASVYDDYTSDIGDFSAAFASQLSTLGQSGFSAEGRVGGEGGGESVGYESRFNISFDVTSRVYFRLRSTLGFTTFHPNGLFDPVGGSLPIYQLEFSRTDQPSTIISHKKLSFEFIDGPSEVFSFKNGILEPGQYRLSLTIGTIISNDSESGSYMLKFDSSAPPPAVPLPPAAWTGLLMLAGVAGGKAYAARRARRAELA